MPKWLLEFVQGPEHTGTEVAAPAARGGPNAVLPNGVEPMRRGLQCAVKVTSLVLMKKKVI